MLGTGTINPVIFLASAAYFRPEKIITDYYEFEKNPTEANSGKITRRSYPVLL